jgi:hypothetical protein
VIKKRLRSAYQRLRSVTADRGETALLLLGKQMSWQVSEFPPNTDFRKVGFKVFSQWDEDGIIQYLINKIDIPSKTFIEFGVENYEESNTRFLLLNNHWQGMVLDASEADIRYVQTDRIHWEFDLQAERAWITRDNIDSLLKQSGFPEDVGLLSIDINGNEYWIWEAIRSIQPRIVIVEYNSLFGLQPVAVPYKEDFDRTGAHYSNLYYGCSLGALEHLAGRKGYILLGSNVWGHNAFFVRADVASVFNPVAAAVAYVRSNFRESRGLDGKLTYVRGDNRLNLIQDLPVVNVITDEQASLKRFVGKPET